ncbi:Transcription factor [Malassezia psittaci]|uniref:Transcription factor n=1 Tax=Malassezia psittaci TaxID=1821823 RepID=A0AAF0FA33_9BASI|nr:Transcription factor [Malassezia psittaci]
MDRPQSSFYEPRDAMHVSSGFNDLNRIPNGRVNVSEGEWPANGPTTSSTPSSIPIQSSLPMRFDGLLAQTTGAFPNSSSTKAETPLNETFPMSRLGESAPFPTQGLTSSMPSQDRIDSMNTTQFAGSRPGASTFPVAATPDSFSQMLSRTNLQKFLSTTPFTSQNVTNKPSNSTEIATSRQMDASNPSQKAPSSSPPGDPNHRPVSKDTRAVGEIGAASGLFMLSHGRDNTEQTQYDDSVNGKRKHADLELQTSREVPLGSPSRSTSPRPDTMRGFSSAKDHEKDETHSDETDSENKRKSFLERNRQAAFKCRQRKKAWLASLQAKVEYLQSDNESLQNTVEGLRAEVIFLKSQLMQQQQHHHHPHPNATSSQAEDNPHKMQATENRNSRNAPFHPGSVQSGAGYNAYPTPANESSMINTGTQSMERPPHSPTTTDNRGPYGHGGGQRMDRVSEPHTLLAPYPSSPATYFSTQETA